MEKLCPLTNELIGWLTMFLLTPSSYGENGTISLASLKSLLQNIGLDRVRTVTVQHRHHHHHGDHPHGDNDAHNLR